MEDILIIKALALILEVINTNNLLLNYIDDSIKNDKDIIEACRKINNKDLPF